MLPDCLPQFPTIHDLRLLNMVSTICTGGFAITATALSIYSGAQHPRLRLHLPPYCPHMACPDQCAGQR